MNTKQWGPEPPPPHLVDLGTPN